MGKRARAQRHVKKMNAKRAAKKARQSEYESLRDANKNKKGKRSGKAVTVKPEKILMEVPVVVAGRATRGIRRVHGGESCNNVGCKRCSSLYV